MARTPVPTEPTPHTKAWMTLDQNLKNVTHMVALGGREIAALHTAAKRHSKTLPGDLTKAKERAKLVRSMKRFTATLQLRVDRFGTATLWQVVMLVTCIEAYLQDLLVDAAAVDAAFMNRSEQVTSYADVVAATSLDELANEMRRRWARGWLSNSGPVQWIPRLQKMGAQDYPVGLAPRLDLVWGIRHITVHTAGVATTDFLKRHPGAAKAVGDRVKVSLQQFSAFVVAAREFLEATDRFFLARCPSLRA
jgi:hypothetical protein